MVSHGWLGLVFRVVLVGGMAVFAAPDASAQARGAHWSTPLARPGFYVGVSGGWPGFVNTEGAGGDNDDGVVAVTGALFGGYRFHPRFALEGMIEVSHGGNLKGDFDRDDDYQITSTMFTVNSRFYFGYERVQPYALIGIGGGETVIDPDDSSEDDDDRSHFVGRLGVGADVYLFNHLAVQLELSGAVGTRSYRQIAPRIGLVGRF